MDDDGKSWVGSPCPSIASSRSNARKKKIGRTDSSFLREDPRRVRVSQECQPGSGTSVLIRIDKEKTPVALFGR